jgi:hypothetical protein
VTGAKLAGIVGHSKEWSTTALLGQMTLTEAQAKAVGTGFKALIHEELSDGMTRAIDFNMDLTREPDPKRNRVRIVMSGKFLPYKSYRDIPRKTDRLAAVARRLFLPARFRESAFLDGRPQPSQEMSTKSAASPRGR